ncbi:MAG: HepT-like ribonuclease domain-containing protein [Thermomicrobiales bacterium]
MRSDELYIRDISEACRDIRAFLSEYDFARFSTDRVMQRAILQALTEIGEAANQVSPELKGRYPEIPWDDARAFRNFAVHRYFAVVWSIVWNTATHNIVELHPQIEELIAAEFEDN